MHASYRRGFTLIELSIVLVIIGLIVGGVLVGRDLIAAAQVRGQISQIEKYNTAVRTFQIKYNCLAGDCKNATTFGFAARTNAQYHGDGDGAIEDCDGTSGELSCEQSLFWNDLGQAHLIDGAFTADTDGPVQAASGSIHQYLPTAKLNSKLSLMVGGCDASFGTCPNGNFFILDYVDSTDASGNYSPTYGNSPHTTGVTPLQGFQIDSKTDDGLPLTGKVVANTNAVPSGYYSNGCNNAGNYWSEPYSTYPIASAANTPSCALGFAFN